MIVDRPNRMVESGSVMVVLSFNNISLQTRKRINDFTVNNVFH